MGIDIKELRNKTGMSQREFAAQYGIPLSTLRKWEQGEAKPATYVVNLISDKVQDKLEYQITIDREQAAKERIRDLIVLQKDLRSKFSEKDYNVFVFGSYPTVRYNNESDVDIAVYSKDLELYKKMSFTIDSFFQNKGIPVDLFYIDISVPAPIYIAPLRAQIQFTDYFPKELKDFEQQCERELEKNKRSMLT